MGFRNVLATCQFFAIPIGLFVGEHDVFCLNVDAELTNVVDRCLFLRTKCLDPCDGLAGAIGDKKYRGTCGPSRGNKFDNAANRRGVDICAPGIELVVGERTFKRQLEIDIANNCFIDIENNGRW